MIENNKLFRVDRIDISSAGSKVLNVDCTCVKFHQLPNFFSDNYRVAFSSGEDRWKTDYISSDNQNFHINFKFKRVKQIFLEWDATPGNILLVITADDIQSITI